MAFLVLLIIFISLILVLFCVITYYVNDLAIQRLRKKHQQREQIRMFELMTEQLKAYRKSPIPSEELARIRRLIMKKQGFFALDFAFKRYVWQYGYTTQLRHYLEQVLDFEQLYRRKTGGKRYQKAYMLYLFEKFQIGNERIRTYILRSLDDPAVYVRHAALKTASALGDPAFFLQALEQIDHDGHYFSEPVLVDNMDRISRRAPRVNRGLVQDLQHFSSSMKCTVIRHFTHSAYRDRELLQSLRRELMSCEDQEILCAVIAYFGKVEDKSAGKRILQLLSAEDAQVRACSAGALVLYENPRVTTGLRKTLVQEDWITGVAAATSLLQMGEAERFISHTDMTAQPVSGADMAAKAAGQSAAETPGRLREKRYLQHAMFLLGMLSGQAETVQTEASAREKWSG